MDGYPTTMGTNDFTSVPISHSFLDQDPRNPCASLDRRHSATTREDIGVFEEADITSLTLQMRVHINGRLPLIKKSVIEYKGAMKSLCILCMRDSKNTARCANALIKSSEIV